MSVAIIGSSPLSLISALVLSRKGQEVVIYEPNERLLGAWARSSVPFFSNNILPASTAERSLLPDVRDLFEGLGVSCSTDFVQVIRGKDFEWESELKVDMNQLITQISAESGISIRQHRVRGVKIDRRGVTVHGAMHSQILLPQHFSSVKFERSSRTLLLAPVPIWSQHFSLVFKSPPPPIFASFQLHMPLDSIFDRAQFLTRPEGKGFALIGRVDRSAKHLSSAQQLEQSEVLSELRSTLQYTQKTYYCDYHYSEEQLEQLRRFLQGSSCSVMSTKTLITGVHWIKSNLL